jgi:peptide/nickel transport system substrate-binding protein
MAHLVPPCHRRSQRPRRRISPAALLPAATAPVAVLAAAAALTAGCSNATGGTSASAASSTLTIAENAPPNSLDPAKNDAALEWYVNLAYDPLIFWGPNGTPQPGLATSWGYTGSGNRTFNLALRPGVRFSDGSPLTAQAVKESLQYQASSAGPAVAYLAGKTFTVTGPLSLRISTAMPDPQLPRELSQDYLAGNIISPVALKNPGKLGTSTDGAGPYVLRPGSSVAGDHYTYTANPHYWNEKAVHYRTVTIKVIPNSNTALDALKTGQADVVDGDYTTAAAAASAGLQVKYAPQVFVGVALLDRAGKLAKPLADPRVRQALNYAVDRKTLTSALFGKYGTPAEQTVCPGQDGYLSGQTYSYAPGKARKLLAAAGYPHGFTLQVVNSTFFGVSTVDQAVAGYLTKVGVQLKFRTQTLVNQYVQDMVAKKYPAAGLGYGCQPIYLQGPSLFLPSAATFNPFGSSDPQLQSLYTKAAGAPVSDRAALDRQIEQRVVNLGWFLPVSLSPVFDFARPAVGGVAPTAGEPITDPVWWHPSA